MCINFCYPGIKCETLFGHVLLQGLRAFLPKTELMRRVNNFSDLKENVSFFSWKFQQLSSVSVLCNRLRNASIGTWPNLVKEHF